MGKKIGRENRNEKVNIMYFFPLRAKVEWTPLSQHTFIQKTNKQKNFF